jgi:hypothetical protein
LPLGCLLPIFCFASKQVVPESILESRLAGDTMVVTQEISIAEFEEESKLLSYDHASPFEGRVYHIEHTHMC